MKSLFLFVSFLVLLFVFVLGKDTSNQVPRVSLSAYFNSVKDEEKANSSLENPQQVKSALELPWISTYVPIRSCHTELRGKYGEFGTPADPWGFEGKIWCNWTVWAGPSSHIIIYINGFKSEEDCDKNEDLIFFHGISAVTNNAVVYACWKEETHVFATYARGVHVVLLMRQSSNSVKEQLMGKYYIFKYQEIKAPSKEAIGCEMPTLKPSQLERSSRTLLQSNKELLMFMQSNAKDDLSADHSIDGLSWLAPLPYQSAIALDGFLSQITRGLTLHLTSESPGLTPTVSADRLQEDLSLKLSEVLSCPVWGMTTEVVPIGSVDSTTPLKVHSSVSSLHQTPLTRLSSPAEGMEQLSRMLLSTSVGLLTANNLWMGSKLTRQRQDNLATHSLAVSYGMLAATEVSNNEAIHSEGIQEVALRNFERNSWIDEAIRRDNIDFKTTLLPHPEQTCTSIMRQGGNLLLPSQILGRSKVEGKSVIGWETGTAAVSEETTKLLNSGSILESFVDVNDQQNVTLVTKVLYSVLESGVHLWVRSSYYESTRAIGNFLLAPIAHGLSVDVSQNQTSGDSNKMNNVEVQSSHCLEAIPRLEPSLSPSKTMAPFVAATEQLVSHFKQDLAVFSMEGLPFRYMELEPSLVHNTAIPFLLPIPDPEPTPSELESALSQLMALTYPFVSTEQDRTLSLPTTFQEPTISGQDSTVFQVTAPISLTDAALWPSPSALECAYSKTATTLQAAMELVTILSPISLALKPVLFPRTTVDSQAVFPPANEITPWPGLQMLNTVKNKITPLSSFGCQHVFSTSDDEGMSLVTSWSSNLDVPVMGAPYTSYHPTLVAAGVESFSSALEFSLIRWPLPIDRNDVRSVTKPGKEDGDTPVSVGHTLQVLESTFEPFLSFDGFTASAHPSWNKFIPETCLLFVPDKGEEKQSLSVTENGFITCKTDLPLDPPNEMQTQDLQPLSVRLVKDETGRLLQSIKSWEIKQEVQWPKELTVANINCPGALIETPTQRAMLDLQMSSRIAGFGNKVASKIGQLWNHNMELGSPWLLVYLPVKSCHTILTDEAGTLSPPTLDRLEVNHWCNWTIWTGLRKHILIYIEDFEGKTDCESNQEKIIFQGVQSSVESKVVDACRNHGVLIFATQAVAVHVVFLSKASSQSHGLKRFKGRYYTFDDNETSVFTSDAIPEKSVLYSNSSVGFPLKPYIIPSQHTRRNLSNKNGMPVINKERGNQTGSAMGLEAALNLAIGNNFQDYWKSPKSVTLKTPDVKGLQVVNSSVDYATGTETETLSGLLKKILVSGSSYLEDEENASLSKQIVPSASPRLSQKFSKTKLVVEKDVGTASKMDRFGKNDQVPTHWTMMRMKDAGSTMFSKPVLQRGGISFPPVSLEEQRTQSTPKDVGMSRKTADIMEFLHLEWKETPEGKRDNQTEREENSLSDQYMKTTVAMGNEESREAELLATEMPPTSMVKMKSQTTPGPPNVLDDPSFFRALNLLGAATGSPWATVSSNRRSTRAQTAVFFHSNTSATKYTKQSQRKYTKPRPSYSSSFDWGLSNKPSLKVIHKNDSSDSVSVFGSAENGSIPEFQHNPGDFLFEITFDIEHKQWIPHNGSEQETALLESIKLQIQKRVKFLSNKVYEVKLKDTIRKDKKERKRENEPNLIFTFWLHLTTKEPNLSSLIHSQLEDLGGMLMGAGEIRRVSVGDVNECDEGIGLCGSAANCLNDYGTYVCQCKEGYEDRSVAKLGTLCVRSPQTGIGSWYSYAEILVGTTTTFIFVLVVVVSVLCTIAKRSHQKKGLSFQKTALSGSSSSASCLQPAAFVQKNIDNLLTLDAAQLKLRAKPPERPLQRTSSPSETYRVSVEQSECL